MNNSDFTWAIFSMLCEMLSQVWIFLLYRGSDWTESDSNSMNAGDMGVTSRDPDTSSVWNEWHCDTQREYAKGITKFFQNSTISQFESKY